MNTPNGRPYFTNRTRTKTVYSKDGKVMVVSSERVVSWPKSAKKQQVCWWLNKLGEIATKHKASPAFANWLGYQIKEMKRDFNPRKWYIPYLSINFNPTKETLLYDIKVATTVLHDSRLGLSEETSGRIRKKIVERYWDFMTTYPLDVHELHKEMVDAILKSPQNAKVYQECSERAKEKKKSDMKGVDLSKL